MAKKETRLQINQKRVEVLATATNKKIENLGEQSGILVDNLNKIQAVFDKIRGLMSEQAMTLIKIKKQQTKWSEQVKKIQEDYQNIELKTVGAGVVGAGAGFAVATLGPTAAMGVATTFGIASTGTAISTLSGAAATNAALAWIGGGALATGGGGMAAGSTFLALTGPIGWSIAGVTLLGSGALFIKNKNDRVKVENICIAISEREIRSYQLSIVEINERMKRINNESQLLQDAITQVESYGEEYDEMTELQQYRLISFVNLMESSTQLLVNPIMGLQSKFTSHDLDEFLIERDIRIDGKKKQLYIVLSNLLFDLELDETDTKLLWKTLKKDENFMNSSNILKKEFMHTDIQIAELALAYKKSLN